MPKIKILTGKRKGDVFDLDGAGDVVEIGTRRSAGLSIRDPWISHKHAKIERDGSRYYIVDVGSSNGTWFNKQKIKRHELSASDVVFLGKTKIQFVVAGGGDASADDEQSPWWDKKLEGASPDARRLQAELADERGMRRALERYLDVPPGTRLGDAAKAGDLEHQVRQLETKLREAETKAPDPAAIEEAVEAEREKAEKARREQMSTIVELEEKVSQAETKAVDLERDLRRAKERAQDEVEELRRDLEEARESAKKLASGGDRALKAERDRVTKLEGELDELREKVRGAEARNDDLERELKEAREAGAKAADPGDLAELREQLATAEAEATRWKEEHGRVLQEIDEISMEQIDVEDELNARIAELEEKLAAGS